MTSNSATNMRAEAIKTMYEIISITKETLSTIENDIKIGKYESIENNIMKVHSACVVLQRVSTIAMALRDTDDAPVSM